MFAKQTCHGAKRSMLASSRVVFAPSFGFAQTNVNHLNPCRDRRPRLSASLFALSFGGAQTNGSLSISVGEGLASSRFMFAHTLGGEEMNGFSIHR